MGDVVATMRTALAALVAADVDVRRVSSPYLTAPRDEVDQPAFVNAAVAVGFDEPPPRLLDITMSVEAALGRVRATRFGPRTIDIDILMWSAGSWCDDRLRIPHPRLAERRFALAPLAEIAPGLLLPDGATVIVAAGRLASDPGQSVEPLPGVSLWPASAD